MESKIPGLTAAAAVMCAFITAATGQNGPAAGVEQSVILRVAPGAKLAPGVHRAEITAAGKKVAGEIVVAAKEEPGGGSQKSRAAGAEGQAAGRVGGAEGGAVPQPPAPESPTFLEQWGPLALAAGTPLLLMLAGGLLYVKVIRPRRLMAPFREAMELVARREYEGALPKLTAIESKLGAAERWQARFTIAFCYVSTKAYGEAELTLAGLRRETPGDVQVMSLLAWLKVLQKRYGEAEPVLDELVKGGHLDEWQVRRLASITKLSLAHKAFGEGRISEAAALFEEVQALGLFGEHVPADLRNHHVVLGLRALFEKDVNEARKQFLEMEASARQATGDERAGMLLKAKLGLALASWVEETPEGVAKAEELLGEAVRLLNREAPLEQEWPKEIPEKSILEKLDGLDGAKAGPRLTETQQCLRDVHFLRAMAVLRGWKAMNDQEAYDRIAEHYERTLRRLACAREADEEFRDVYLTAGLLMYYTHKTGETRSAGVALLKRAKELGVRDPETLEILAAREKRDRLEADAAAQYMEVLDRYLADQTVRSSVRTALIRKLTEFGRFPSFDRLPDLGGARGVEPSVEEIRRRSETLTARLAELLKVQGDGRQAMRNATEALNQQSRVLAEQARTVEQREAELLLMAGEVLFSDDVQEAGAK